MGAFLTIRDRKLDLLTITQGFEPVALNGAEVYKDIRTIFLRDKTVAFGLIESLHGTRNC